MLSQVFNFKVLYKVSFGGPRDDRYYNIVFPHSADFQLHVYKSYQRITREVGSQVKSACYIDQTSGEEVAFVSKRGILFHCSLGPLFFNPETIGFDMIGLNPLK